MGSGISETWASQASESEYKNFYCSLIISMGIGKNSKSHPVIILTCKICHISVILLSFNIKFVTFVTIFLHSSKFVTLRTNLLHLC